MAVFGVNSKPRKVCEEGETVVVVEPEEPVVPVTPAVTGLIMSPLPTGIDELAAAVDVLARAIGASTADAERVLGVASALTEKFAPTAPQSVRNEACIRTAGYLVGSDYGGVQTEGAADQTVTYASHPIGGSSAFRRSGAMGLLSAWRVRRTG